jgi:pimeloyl-ACP methyl ester carboxylesterase
MCHGLITANLATWYFSAAPILARSYQVVLYDLRGHGKSTLAATGYDLDTMSRDLACVIEAHRPTHFSGTGAEIVLVGHSYGALIALNYALRHPQRVSRLVLIDAPLPASRYVHPSLERIESPSALQMLLRAADPTPPTRGLRRQRAAARLEFLIIRSSLREDVGAASDLPDACLETLTVPTLCLYGRHSDCTAAGLRLARLLPFAELRWLECDHFIPTRLPAEMTQQLVSYLMTDEREVVDHAVHNGVR